MNLIHPTSYVHKQPRRRSSGMSLEQLYYYRNTDTSYSESLTRELTFPVGSELESTLLGDKKGTQRFG